MTPKPHRPTNPDPITAADAAAALADAGLASDYEEARREVEATREEVKANAVGDGVIGPPV